jgi:exopolysaccharide biosynthesis polyprenyl glycosylphosphotransferase
MAAYTYKTRYWFSRSAAALNQLAPVDLQTCVTPISEDDHRNINRSPSPRTGRRWVQITYAMIDVACVILNGALAFQQHSFHYFFVDIGFWRHIPSRSLTRYWGFLLLYSSLIVLFCHWYDLYRTPRLRSAQEESFAVFKAVSFATLLLTAFIYLSDLDIVSRRVMVIGFVLNSISLAAWRYAKRRTIILRVTHGLGARNAIIIGAGRVGQALAEQLEENRLLGYRFKGFLDSNHSNDPRTLGKLEDLPRIARSEFIDEVFITIPSERELVKSVSVTAQQSGFDVKVIPELYDGLGWDAPIHYLGDFPIMELHWKSIPTFGLFLKRITDVVCSTLGLIICFPVLAVLGLCIKFDSRGTVLYRSRRAGRKGRLFTCYKLRTMVANADVLKDGLRKHNERQGPFFKMSQDPRITRVGRILRRYSLDELPQLWNVFKGDMSLVGPRPHPLDDYEQYDLDHLRRLQVRPGITGLWQVTARSDPSFQTNMRLDIEYMDSWTMWLDIEILLKTVPAVFRGGGQ